MSLFTRLLIALTLFIGAAAPAMAYIGPGAGLSLLGALWGLLAAIGAALLFIIVWPFRRMMRRKRQSATTESTTDTHSDDAQDPHSR